MSGARDRTYDGTQAMIGAGRGQDIQQQPRDADDDRLCRPAV